MKLSMPPEPERSWINRLRGLFTIVIAISYTITVTGCTQQQNARSLQLQGARYSLCKKNDLDAKQNECGEKSIWLEADSGVTAYVTIYGVTKNEALEVAAVLRAEKARDGHDIPIVISAYSTPRAQGREPSAFLIFKTNIR